MAGKKFKGFMSDMAMPKSEDKEDEFGAAPEAEAEGAEEDAGELEDAADEDLVAELRKRGFQVVKPTKKAKRDEDEADDEDGLDLT